MRKQITLAAALCMAFFAATNLNAQDIHFSQFYEIAILRNPGLTGIFSGDYKAGVNYKRQWSQISVPFQTVFASAEVRIPTNDAGDVVSFGLATTFDKAGSISFNSLQAYPAINYSKCLEDKHQSYLSAGFTAGYVQRSVDPSKMTFASQYQSGGYNSGNASGENFQNVKLNYYDIGAGVSFNSSMGEFNNVNYYIGAAAFHINKPRAAFNSVEASMRLDMKWNGNLGINYHVNERVGVTVHGNYSRQGKYQEILAGGLCSWRNIDESGTKTLFTVYGGMFMRLGDAFIPTVKLDYKAYSFTFSYDINTSNLKTASNSIGGMEISIFTRGVLSKGPWAQNKNKCPRFEDMILPEFQ